MTRKNLLLAFVFLFTFVQVTFIFSGGLFAEQIQTIPITPQYQPAPIPTQPIQQQQPTLPQLPPQPVQPAPLQQLQPPAERLSVFEQFVSGKVEITEIQFEMLKNHPEVKFSFTSQPLAMGNVAIPIKVVRGLQKTEGVTVTTTPEVFQAGFIIGTIDAIDSVFKILGIKSSFVISTDIKQFGYDIFRQSPSTFAPVERTPIERTPVGPDYVIGPGDEIRINVWGRIEGQWNVVVDRDGTINLPKVGTIGITGLTFKELREMLQREFSKYFTGFEMNVSMGALRTIRGYVVGNAERPGAYTISSLSTLINALFEAGGPSKTGTMRDIQVKRNGKTIVHFDIYDLLLKGDKTKDIRLMPEDVIFIPPVGPLVGIVGNVRNPAIYEIKGETIISELIEMAGGLSDIAFSEGIQIERIINNNRQTISGFGLVEAKSMKMQGGDLVKIFTVVQDKRTLKVSGAIHREGEYGFNPGMTVKDLILMAGGLKYYAYNKEAELTRIHITDKGPTTEKILINLEKALAGESESNALLKEDDYLFVRTVPEWQLYRMVGISGEIKFPGIYTVKKGEKLSSLIERAGGYTDRAYLRGATFTREKVRELQQKQIDEMTERLEREMLGKGVSEVGTALSPEDAKIKETEIAQKRAFIAALKAVKAKGRMVLKIDQPEILKNTPFDIELEEGDSLFIMTNPRSVQVIGSVYNQTAFVYDKDKDITTYVDSAGGYTENADKKRVYLLKADGTAVRPSSGFLGISWSKSSNRWESGGSNLESGDTIVVPERLERIAWLREIKDITQILFQVATTAGVVLLIR